MHDAHLQSYPEVSSQACSFLCAPSACIWYRLKMLFVSYPICPCQWRTCGMNSGGPSFITACAQAKFAKARLLHSSSLPITAAAMALLARWARTCCCCFGDRNLQCCTQSTVNWELDRKRPTVSCRQCHPYKASHCCKLCKEYGRGLLCRECVQQATTACDLH